VGQSLLKRMLSIAHVTPRQWARAADPGIRGMDQTFARLGQLANTQALDRVVSLEAYQRQMFRRYLDRNSRFVDFDIMDMDCGEISVALDTYAEEATQRNFATKRVTWAVSKDPTIQKEADAMIQATGLENFAFGICRALAKYGEILVYLRKSKEKGVYRFILLHPSLAEPELEQGKLIGWRAPQLAEIFPVGVNGLYPASDFVHFRIPDFSASQIEGKSMLDPAIKPWRILDMLEITVQIFRLNRSIDRRVFKVDVGSAATLYDQMRLVQEYMKFVKGRSVIDPATGEFKIAVDPNNVLEDIFWPTKEGNNSSVEYIKAEGNVGEILDLQYFRNKLRVATRLPKGFFDENDSSGWDKGRYLMFQDVRFARVIERLQLAFCAGVKQMVLRHVTMKGLFPNGIPKFEIMTEVASQVYVKQVLDNLRESADAISAVSDFADVAGWNKAEWIKWLTSAFMQIPSDIMQKLALAPDQNLGVGVVQTLLSGMEGIASDKQLAELSRRLEKIRDRLAGSIAQDLTEEA